MDQFRNPQQKFTPPFASKKSLGVRNVVPSKLSGQQLVAEALKKSSALKRPLVNVITEPNATSSRPETPNTLDDSFMVKKNY